MDIPPLSINRTLQVLPPAGTPRRQRLLVHTPSRGSDPGIPCGPTCQAQQRRPSPSFETIRNERLRGQGRILRLLAIMLWWLAWPQQRSPGPGSEGQSTDTRPTTAAARGWDGPAAQVKYSSVLVHLVLVLQWLCTV